MVELMVVVAIVGILGAIAIVGMITSRENRQLQSAASTLAGNLQLARMQAIREGIDVTLAFDGPAYNVFIDANGNRIFDAGERLLAGPVDLPPGITIGQNTFMNGAVVFNSRGMLNNNGGGRVMFRGSGGNNRQVTVQVFAPTGRIQVETTGL